jgi:hypothetical protein
VRFSCAAQLVFNDPINAAYVATLVSIPSLAHFTRLPRFLLQGDNLTNAATQQEM